MGVTFTAGPGDYAVGDWWGARLRSESGNGIEERAAASPDGILHSFAPLALVDLDARTVLSDCRPTFISLVDLDFERRRVHRLGQARRRPPGGDRLAAARRRRALPRGRRLRARHTGPGHRAGADRDQRRRPGVDHRRPTERGGHRLRHLQRRRGARRHRPGWQRPGGQRRPRPRRRADLPLLPRRPRQGLCAQLPRPRRQNTDLPDRSLGDGRRSLGLDPDRAQPARRGRMADRNPRRRHGDADDLRQHGATLTRYWKGPGRLEQPGRRDGAHQTAARGPTRQGGCGRDTRNRARYGGTSLRREGIRRGDHRA